MLNVNGLSTAASWPLIISSLLVFLCRVESCPNDTLYSVVKDSLSIIGVELFSHVDPEVHGGGGGGGGAKDV